MSSPRGTFEVIADLLRQELAAQPDPRAPLPAEAALRQRYGVSRTTVRRALQRLADEGLVESVPGVGWRPVQAAGRRPLVDRILGVIGDDELAPGDAFPSEHQLARRFGISRSSVRRALAQLEGQGVLVARPGKGRTVRSTAPSRT